MCNIFHLETYAKWTPALTHSGPCVRNNIWRCRLQKCRYVVKLHVLLFQWPFPPRAYQAYRCLLAAYFLCWMIYAIYHDPTFLGHVWPVFLTSWAYVMLVSYLILSAIVSLCRCKDKPAASSLPTISDKANCHLNPKHPEDTSVTVVTTSYQDNRLPWDIKIEWILFAVGSNSALFVSLMYFSVVYPYLHGGTDYIINGIDLHFHGLNSLVVIVDLMLSAFPVRLLHVIYTIMFGMSYVVCSLIYWLIDRANVVYPGVLDWNQPLRSLGVICFFSLVVVPFFKLTLFGIFRFRLWVYDTLFNKDR